MAAILNGNGNGNGKQGSGQAGGARRRYSPETRLVKTRLCEYKSNNSKSNANQL